MEKAILKQTVDKLTVQEIALLQDEYVDNGHILCKKCNTRRTIEISLPGITTGIRKVRCLCKCKKEAMDRQEALEKEKKEQKKIDELRKKSFLGGKYSASRFDNTRKGSASFNSAYLRCKKYVENIEEVLEKGLGIYIYGNVGCGKTHLTSCIANALLDKKINVVCSSFLEINQAVRETYTTTENESSTLDFFKKAKVLILDDLGIENLSKNNGDNFNQTLIFEVLNYRYNHKLSTIFTSNYNIEELHSIRNFELRTVDRLKELSSAILKIEDISKRSIIKEALPF